GRGGVPGFPDAAAVHVQDVVAVGGIDLDVVDPAGEAVVGRRMRHRGRDLAPGAAAVIGQLDDLLAAVVAPGVGHAQCNAGGRAGAEDGQAAVAGGVVAVEQGPGAAAVELVETGGTGRTRARALGEHHV